MLKLLAVLWFISGIVASAIVVWLAYRKAHPKPSAPCESCMHLKEISSKGRYDCSKVAYYFWKPPKYCGRWCPRGDSYDKM